MELFADPVFDTQPMPWFYMAHIVAKHLSANLTSPEGLFNDAEEVVESLNTSGDTSHLLHQIYYLMLDMLHMIKPHIPPAKLATRWVASFMRTPSCIIFLETTNDAIISPAAIAS